MHVLDYEPMWNPANHSLSTTLPALLALAEMLGRRRSVTSHRLDGRRLLTALVLGIEAQQRMRLASGQLEPGGLMFHPPGAVGAFGSAVACGVLLGLDAATLAQAVGRISCESIAGYPPGIPALLPGERISAEVIDQLRQVVKTGAHMHGASDPELGTIAVLAEDRPA